MDRKKQTEKDGEKDEALSRREISSASVKNASASGDGAVQKSDEIILTGDDDDTDRYDEAY